MPPATRAQMPVAPIAGVSILGAVTNQAQEEILSPAAQTFVATLHRCAARRRAADPG